MRMLLRLGMGMVLTMMVWRRRVHGPVSSGRPSEHVDAVEVTHSDAAGRLRPRLAVYLQVTCESERGRGNDPLSAVPGSRASISTREP